MKPSVHYTYPGPSSFANKDIEILKKHFGLKLFEFDPSRKKILPFNFIRQFFSLLFNFFSTDIFICQFAGYPSLLPAAFSRISGKPCLIITGGTDSVSFPSIHYGNFHKKLLGKITEWSLRWCTHIAPVHKSLMLCDYTYEHDDFPRQGANYFCKNLKTPYTVIYNGYDANSWKKNDVQKKPNSFLTVVASLQNEYRFKLKGIDLIFSIAPQFPECRFTIVGLDKNSGIKIPSDNIIAIPALPHEELRAIFSAHEFYLQLSMSEGFPNTLAESMLMECIPIGSNVASIPDIIKDSGFILKEKDISQLTELIQKALKSDKPALSKRARQIIIDNYSLENREKGLKDLITTLVKK